MARLGRWWGICCIAGALACLPTPHSVVGRPCAADAECGTGLVCHRNACATAGSIDTVSLDLAALIAQGTNEGGLDITVDSIRRTPTRVGLQPFVAGAAMPIARAGHATACAGPHCFVIGGSTGPTALADVSRVAGSFATVTPLPSARTQLAATAAGNRVYVLGGRPADGTLLSDVVSALVNPDGSLSAWDIEPSLPSPRAGLVAASLGSVVYAIGGETAVGVSGDVLGAAIDSQGRLSPFTSARAIGIVGGRANAGAAVFAGSLYLVAGTCDVAACPTLQLTPSADGSATLDLATFVSPGERINPAVVSSGGMLHVLGGRRSDGSTVPDVQSLILPPRATSQWRTQTRLPAAVSSAAALASPTGLTMLGGRSTDGGTTAQTWLGQGANGELGSFDDLPTVPDDLQLARAVSWNGGVYVAGSDTNAGQLDTIYRTTLAADGGFERWSIAGRFPRRTADLGLVAWGGRLYAVGGCETAAGDSACFGVDTVQSADLFADGGLGPFKTIATMPDELAGPSVAVVNGWLMVVGGLTGYTDTHAEVRAAKIDPVTGSLGAFKTTASLPRSLWSHSMVSIHGTLYVVGGGAGGFGDYSDQVFAGRVANDGTIAGWSVAGRLPQPRGRLATIAFDDTIYVAGGCNENPGSYCDNHQAGVLAASLLPDAGLGAFATVGTLSWARNSLAAATLGGKLLTLGGYDGNPKGDSEAASLFARGGVGRFTQWTAQTPGDGFAAASDGSRIVAVSADATAGIGAAPGSAGMWVAGESLPAHRLRGSAAIYRQRLYFAGGTDGSTAQPQVWSASLDGEHIVAPWRAETALPTALSGHSLVAGPRGLYLTGGEGSAAVWFARPNADGSISAWQTSTALPASRHSHRAVIAADHLYVIGGVSDGDVGSVLLAPLTDDGIVGEWSSTSGLPGPRAGHGAIAREGFLYVSGGVGPSGATADLIAAPMWPDGSLGSWAATGSLGTALASNELVESHGSLVALSATTTSFAAMLTPSARGTFSLRLDLGRTASEIETITVSGSASGRFRVEAKTDNTPWQDLGTAVAGEELRFGQPGRLIWLRITLDDSQSSGGPSPGSVRDLTGVSLSLKL